MTFFANASRPRHFATGTALTFCFVSGCLADPPDSAVADPADVDELGSSIIGGIAATGGKLEAVGSISIMTVDAAGGMPTFREQCTGALIGPRTVLTAKHCLSVTTSVDATRSVVFTLGPDAAAPLAYATAIDAAGAPGDEGGYTGHGHDVGVLQLATPLADVPVVRVASVSDAEVGQKFIGIGFGNKSNSDSTPTRTLGELTLRARAGRMYEVLYGSFEAFHKAQMGSAPPTGCPVPGQPVTVSLSLAELCAIADRLREIYEATLLEKVEELAVGGVAGDAQPCYGDSGGPLLRANANDELIAYGVTTGGVPSEELICDRGAIYASFGLEVVAFLTQALSWRDPCEVVPVGGACQGDRAQRCSTPAEGHRRLIEVDCSLAGLQCTTTAAGAVCGERKTRAPR